VADAKTVGKSATLLSSVEVGLGSIIHAFHIPGGGHLLSLNQGVILLWSTQDMNQQEAIQSSQSIAWVTALLKSLSPAGKRLTPMLAIGVQGFLYSLGALLFGNTLPGALLGMTLLSLWGFIQPLIFTYFVFGKTFFESLAKLVGSTDNLVAIFTGLVALKVVSALVIGVVAWFASSQKRERYLKKVTSYEGVSVRHGKHFLLQPIFLISYALSIGFFFMSETQNAEAVWTYLLRPIALAWLVFWVFKMLPASWIEKLAKRFPVIYQAFNEALKRSRTSNS